MLVPIRILKVFIKFLLHKYVVLNIDPFQNNGQVQFFGPLRGSSKQGQNKTKIGFEGNLRAESDSALNFTLDRSRLAGNDIRCCTLC